MKKILLIFSIVMVFVLALREAAAQQSTIVGLIGLVSTGEGDQLYIEPLLSFADGEYKNIYVEPYQQVDARRLQAIKSQIAGKNTYYVYSKGQLVATFSVGGMSDLSQMGGSPLAIKGTFRWQTAAPKDLYAFRDNSVAISKRIAQSGWKSSTMLTPKQKTGLDKILGDATARATTILSQELQKRGTASPGPQKCTGARGPITVSDVIDVDQDGQPEVLAQYICNDATPCNTMQSTVFLTWSATNWQTIKRSTYLAECPGLESTGDDVFEVLPVDIDGDGSLELLWNEGRWENFHRSVFSLENGKLVKLLDFGDYGS